MKPVFDENGLAVEPGDIRCFYYDPETGEYTGWSDEYIHPGVSMPGDSTDIDPGEAEAGKVSLFTGSGWRLEEDHRGETVYSVEDKQESVVDYIGSVRDGFVTVAPTSLFDEWNGKKWVTDKEAQHAADVETAELQRQALIDAAMASVSLIQLKLQAGRKLTTAETTKLNTVLDYIEEVEATASSTAPDINWPVPPEV
ncbi:tail fiber assembly protein [Citrobacter farmeri]|uniref:tail fiber assembly protein n=1 Tax=Citrobacter farmeri TaxID=67824 RepID=UPI0018ABD507|nr:tail fiber assembly protein [Citrobacter farmeri]MDB2183063.1 tail fiber assembly protein [Citrobacter farmeri]